MYEIDFYEDDNGYSEIKNFLEKLNSSNAKKDKILFGKIQFQLEILSNKGGKIRPPHSKLLKGYRHTLLELRPMPERIFYAQWQEDRFVLLSHYTKKKDKTDPREIDKALRLLDDWLERNGD